MLLNGGSYQFSSDYADIYARMLFHAKIYIYSGVYICIYMYIYMLEIMPAQRSQPS